MQSGVLIFSSLSSFHCFPIDFFLLAVPWNIFPCSYLPFLSLNFCTKKEPSADDSLFVPKFGTYYILLWNAPYPQNVIQHITDIIARNIGLSINAINKIIIIISNINIPNTSTSSLNPKST